MAGSCRGFDLTDPFTQLFQGQVGDTADSIPFVYQTLHQLESTDIALSV
jgi:hypothetical protein